MGRLQILNSSSSTSAMDIDPHATAWNTLCPSFLDPKRNRISLQDDSSGHVIGSPPSAGNPRVLWNDTFSADTAVPNSKSLEADSARDVNDKGTVESSELSRRMQGIRLQPTQPMIICETIDEEKVDAGEKASISSVSLSVPQVDVTNEKMRPPMSTSY